MNRLDDQLRAQSHAAGTGERGIRHPAAEAIGAGGGGRTLVSGGLPARGANRGRCRSERLTAWN